MRTTQDHSTLKWIKEELDKVIRRGRDDLEEYMEGTQDPALMESCASVFHQVHGTLKMMQLYGAGMLAEEMELVARELAQGTIRRPGDAAEALLQGIIKLPDYLERLQSGGQDHPIIILPLLNDLRASREKELLSEAGLFAPDLEKKLSALEMEGEPNRELRRIARLRRQQYQKGLLDWYRHIDPVAGISTIREILQELEENAGTGPVRRLFQMARAASIIPLDNPDAPNTALKRLFGRLDLEIRRVITSGEIAVVDSPPIALQKNLLYYSASSDSEDDLVRTIKEEYNLEQGIITQDEIELGRKGLKAPNRELMAALHEAIGNDLNVIKDELDLYIRMKPSQAEQLVPLEQKIRKVADTLGMLGEGALRNRMNQQAEKLQQIAASKTMPEEADLMAMAGDIVFVETSLSNLAALGSTEIHLEEIAEPASVLPAGEFEKLVDTVMKEAHLDMAQIKEAMVTFIKSPSRIDVLEGVPARFRSIAGAFEMLKLHDVSELLRTTANYVVNGILAKQAVPEQNQLNAFADAVTSIEYFMETVSEGRGVHKEILEIARDALAKLETGEGAPEALEEPVAIEAEVSPAEAQHSTTQLPHYEIGSEILEIFLEEAH